MIRPDVVSDHDGEIGLNEIQKTACVARTIEGDIRDQRREFVRFGVLVAGRRKEAYNDIQIAIFLSKGGDDRLCLFELTE